MFISALFDAVTDRTLCALVGERQK